MNCSVCKKEDMWLEVVGSDFVCHRCIQKHKIMGNLYRTHTDSFRFALKKLKIENFEEMMKLEKKDILKFVDLGKVLNLR